MSDAGFRVTLRMEIRPGMAADFERTWNEVGDSVTSFAGNRGQWLARSVDEPDVYYVTSDWADEAAFSAFETSDRHLAHRVRLHPYRSAGSMTSMRIVAARAPGGAS